MGWSEGFAGLDALAPDHRRALEQRSRVVELAADTTVFAPGMAADNLLLVLQGSVRVQQLSETGREIVLYRVAAGESCVMTTAALIAQDSYAAYGITETACRAVMIPRPLFDDLLARSEPFRRLVFASYAQRIADLFAVIEALAFQRVDIRLAQRLLRLAGADHRVTATHQQLATELGTAREVVSRQLQEFHRRGWIETGRGVISITDSAGLQRLAAAPTTTG